MPVQFDEYGIPVKQKSQPEVDDYGIPIKKKVGGNGNGSISETPPNTFLAAKRPTGTISNAQVLEAKQGIGAAQNRSTEQQIAAGTPLQREILSDKGSWTREQVNQAAINTADKYFENNPELTFSLNKLKKETNTSLKNIAPKEEDMFSVKALKNSTAYQRKVAEIKTAFEEGNLALTKFQSGEKSGQAVFTRPAKFLRGIGQGIEGSFGMTKDAVISMISDDKEFADYLDKQQRNLPEIPTEAPRGISNEIGMQVGSLIKPMAEFGVGAAITSETGGWGGFVALAADAIPSRTTAKTKELYFEKIAQLQEKYGENIPEEERIKAMKEARSDAPLQAIPEEAMEMYMFGRGTQALGTTPTGLSAFKKSLEKAGVEIPKMGLLGGAEEAVSLGISRLQGNEVHDAGKKIGQAIEDWAAMEAAFKVVHGVINSPKYLRSSAKEALSEHPEVEVKLTEEAVAQGWITKEQADIVQADLEQYNRIRSTLPDDLPSDKAAAVTGLLQRNETLEQQKKTRNEIFHDEIDAEIANNTTKAKQILNSSQPLKYETDELTGERGQDVGGRPSTITEEKVETKTEITPEETDVRVTAVDERKPTDEGSKTKENVGEVIQPQQNISEPINTKQDAIQKPTTTEKMLRNESEGAERNVGLRPMEQGNKSKIVAEKEKETVNTKDKDVPLSEKESVIGSEFTFKGKQYIVQNVESNGVHAKPKGEEKSPLKLIIPVDKFNEISGKNIEAPKRKIVTAEDKAESEIISKAEKVKYKGGENGREYIDRYIADGYDKVISIKQGAVNKFYLDNEKTGLQLPISGDLRKYAELALKKQKSEPTKTEATKPISENIIKTENLEWVKNKGKKTGKEPYGIPMDSPSRYGFPEKLKGNESKVSIYPKNEETNKYVKENKIGKQFGLRHENNSEGLGEMQLGGVSEVYKIGEDLYAAKAPKGWIIGSGENIWDNAIDKVGRSYELKVYLGQEPIPKATEIKDVNVRRRLQEYGLTEESQKNVSTSSKTTKPISEIKSVIGRDVDFKGNRKQAWMYDINEYDKKDFNSVFNEARHISNKIMAWSGTSGLYEKYLNSIGVKPNEKGIYENTEIKDLDGYMKFLLKNKADFFSKEDYNVVKEYEKLHTEGKYLPSSQLAINIALDEGKYQKAISEGIMTANDAKRIIESAGLEVPKDILELANKEKNAATPTKVTEPSQQIKEPTKEQTIKETVSEDIKSDRPIGAETKPTVLSIEDSRTIIKENKMLWDERNKRIEKVSDKFQSGKLNNKEYIEEINRVDEQFAKEHPEYYKFEDGNIKNSDKVNNAAQNLYEKGSEKLLNDLKEGFESAISSKTEATKPKGKYETKANEIADKIRKTELPSWLSSKDPNIKKQGIGADEMKELLAQAVIKMGKLLDGTKEFSKAAREAVQDLVKALGKEREEEIVKGFSDYYNEQTGNKPKQEPLDDLVSVQYPPTQLSHGGTERIRGEFGGEEAPIKEEGSFLKWEKEANDKIKEGFNTNKLLDRMENEDYRPSEVEHIILTKQADALAQKLRDIGKTKGIDSKEFDATLEQIDRINRLSDIAGSKEGKGLVARRFRTINDDSLVGFLLQEKELNKGAPLTENQKKTAINEFEAIKAANEEYQAKFEKLQADYAKLLAERKVKKQAAKKTTKKTHEDFVKERKDISQSIKDKLKKLRGETNVTVLPYANELIAIAPDVAKLAKSLIEEGVVKLEEVVKNIHGQLKQDIHDITEKDVQDIIAGNYNEKKKTRGQVAEQYQNLRMQAQLMNKLDDLMKGSKPKNEKQQIQRNQEIHNLQEKIKDWKKENPNQEAQLQTLKKRNETELKKVQEQLKKGDFAPPIKKVALSVDNELKKNFPKAYKEALESRDKLIKAKQERMIRRAEKEFDNLDSYEKFKKKAARWLNVPRTLMASFDFSAPLRQAAVATTAHPFSAARAARQMFKHGWSQKAYDRWFEELQESPNYDLMKESKLAITDPYNLHLEKLEEDFLGGNVAEKFPLGIGRGVKASERAYVSYLNKMRIDLFNRYAEQFMDNGKTFQNSPELYKSLANFINASTGRGKLGGDKLEAAAPILNSLLFSPRLIASRINLLTNWANPNFYRKVPYEVRKLYFQDMAKFIGVGITTLYLAKQLGADVELDPRSSDFGKIRIGDTRYDIWGGFQQYVRVFAQIFSGDRKTELGIKDLDETFGESRAEVAESFARGKLAPIPAMIMDIASGRTSAGEKVNKNFQFPNPENETSFTEMAIGHLSPLLIQDVIKASKEDGIKSIFTTGVPAMFGIGVQNYDPSKTARQFDLKDTDWQFLLQKTGRLPLLNESQYTLVDESGKRRDMTEKEKDEFTKLRNKKIKDAIKSLRENGALLFDVDGNVTEVKAAKDMTNEEVKKWVEPITSRATAEAKSELFGDNVDLDKIKIETNE